MLLATYVSDSVFGGCIHSEVLTETASLYHNLYLRTGELCAHMMLSSLTVCVTCVEMPLSVVW